MTSQTILCSNFPLIKKYNWEEKELIHSGPFAQKQLHYYLDVLECVKVVDANLLALDQTKKYMDKHNDMEKETLAQNISYIYQNKLYIRMSLYDESLKDVIQDKSYSLENILTFIQKMVHIMRNSEAKVLVHGNLKPSNIFIKNNEYQLSDCGFHHLYATKQQQLIGLSIYSSPEFIMNYKISQKSDVWSFGLIIYELIFGYLPWPNRNVKSYKSSIIKLPLSFPHDTIIGNKLKDFIQRCLVVDEHSRMSWEKAASHPLVVDGNLGNPEHIFDLQYDSNMGVSLLLKLQTEIIRKDKSINRIIDSYKNRSFNLQFFKKACMELTSYMTDQEMVSLFQILKCNKGFDSWGNFKKILFEVDFRSKNNHISRFMKQLSEIATHQQIEIEQIRQMLKNNQSEIVTFETFKNLVKTFLPHMHSQEIIKIWRYFEKQYDKDVKSSNIVKDIQINLLKKPSKNQKQKIITDLKDFRHSFNQYGNVTISQMIKFFDKNNDKMIGFSEFKQMVNTIFKYVSNNELKMMFDDIDTDHSGKISSQQIKNFLRTR